MSPRLALLEGEKNSLKLKTDAYQWFKKNHNKPERILKVGLAGKYTVSAGTGDKLVGCDKFRRPENREIIKAKS